MPDRHPKPANYRATIIRLEKVARYLVVDNALFSEAQLSWEARGLMGYLLSKPDDWRVRLYDLVAHGPAGVHKIQRMLRELEDAGYLHRKRVKRSNGAFDWETTVFETPSLNPLAARPPKFPDARARIPRLVAKNPRGDPENPDDLGDNGSSP
jgi:hypothetical protein